MSDDHRDERARKMKLPPQSESIPGPVYANPNEDQHADEPKLDEPGSDKDEER